MNRYLKASVCALALLSSMPSYAASVDVAAFAPTSLKASLSVTTTSGNVALPSADPTVEVRNEGANDVYVKFGVDNTVVATTNDFLVKSGKTVILNAKQNTYIAGITAASTSTLRIFSGTGNAPQEFSNSVSSSDATAANQATQITAEQAIQTSVASIATNTTGVSTSSKQDTGNASLSSIATNTSGSATAANQATANTSLGTIATNSGTQATAANQATINTSIGTTNTDIGAPGSTVCATDTGSCNTNALLQRVLQKLTTNSNVGGYNFFVTDQPGLTAGAYASGNCVGGLQTISVARTTGGSGILSRVTAMFKTTTALTPTIQFYFFSSNPSGSTCTDKSTFTIAAADVNKLMGTFSLTFAAPTGTTLTEAEINGLAMHFVTSGNTNIYLMMASGSAFTPANPDLEIQAGGIQD